MVLLTRKKHVYKRLCTYIRIYHQILVMRSNGSTKYYLVILTNHIRRQNFTNFLICDIDLRHYYSKSKKSLAYNTETKERFLPVIGSVERMEIANTSLSLQGLTSLLNGIANITYLDLSKNDVTCEDCEKNPPCDCDNVQKLDNLIRKVDSEKQFRMENNQGCAMELGRNKTIEATNKSLCILLPSRQRLIVAVCVLSMYTKRPELEGLIFYK